MAVKDARTRPEHQRWHGTILPYDHPWWDSHSPPCGWRCRCTLQQLSRRDLEREGWTVNAEPPADDTPPQDYINARTGERSLVPEGVDPGFAYHKGKAARAAEAARRLMDKVAELPAPVGAALADPTRLAPALADDFAAWYDGLDMSRPRGESRPVGMLTPPVLRHLATLGITPASAVIAATDHRLAHAQRDAHSQKTDTAPASRPASWCRMPSCGGLPEHLAAAAVYWDADKENLIYVIPGDGVRPGKVVVAVEVRRKECDAATGKRVMRVLNEVFTALLFGPDMPKGGRRFTRIDQ